MQVSIKRNTNPDTLYYIEVDGEYKGALIRNGGNGLLWASSTLEDFMGCPFSTDNPNEYDALKEFEDFLRSKQGYQGGRQGGVMG